MRDMMRLCFLCALLLVQFYAAEPKSRVSRQVPVPNSCTCFYKNSCGCYCTDPITWEDFQLLPAHFRSSCERFTLALRGGTFYSFYTDYFSKIGHVKDFVLDVGDSTFSDLLDAEPNSPFRNVSFEVSGYIRMNNVAVRGNWNWGSFYSLRPTLSLSYCEVQILYSSVPTLTSNFGRICQGAVTVANVMHSRMTSMDNGVFSNFRKLNEVDLTGNRLLSIRRSHFRIPASELETISLANNNIRSLPSDMFTEMPSLQQVNLQGNPITTLDENTYKAIFPYVSIIGIESFPLNCDCRIRWLKEPGQQCGTNVYGLAGAICDQPSRLRGRSFFNETLPRDLVC